MTYGVYGQTDTTHYGSAGVKGVAGTSGGPANNKVGVFGETDTGYGVYGISRDDIGVYGVSLNGTWGIYGMTGMTNTVNYGVYGSTISTALSAAGVFGEAAAGSGGAYGVYGKTTSTDASAAGVFGTGGSGTNLAADQEVGVYGESHHGYGVFGVSIDHAGVYGASEGGNAGVYGENYAIVGHGGHFVNLNTSSTGGNAQVGVWAGSYYGNPIEAHEVNASGTSVDRVFYVDWNGQVYADGTFFDSGADFAEMLPAVEGLEPADVLVIDLDGKLAKSTQAYQPTVVGVYSTEPGFLGGADEEGNPEDEIPLAIVGVVPVKASAENGAIQPGDMLVASTTPGHAMKAGADAPNGTVIGKALESLDDGSGVILMLVMLQ
jgi:hypothetical protein